MPARNRPAVLDRPSLSIFSLIILTALVFSICSFPFMFHAFGPSDNPFDQPTELLWIATIAIGYFPVLLIIVVTRRAALKLFGP